MKRLHEWEAILILHRNSTSEMRMRPVEPVLVVNGESVSKVTPWNRKRRVMSNRLTRTGADNDGELSTS